MLNNFVLVVVQAGETGVCAEMFGGGVLASRAAREKSRDVSCVFNPFSPSHERPVRSCWCFSPRFSVREIENACSHSRPSACSMVARHEQRSLARLEPSEKNHTLRAQHPSGLERAHLRGIRAYLHDSCSAMRFVNRPRVTRAPHFHETRRECNFVLVHTAFGRHARSGIF